MKEIDAKSLKEWQYLMLKVLLEFKRICEKNNIKYNLAGGTLIGAVRHKGFIPWDDDIDVALRRDEYEKFLKACKTDLSDDFFLQTPETDSAFPYGAKLMLLGTHYETAFRPKALKYDGIYIDILVYDNIPDNYFKRFFYCNLFYVIVRVYAIRLGYNPHPPKFYQRFVLKILNLFFLIVSTERLKKILSSYPVKYNNKKTKEVCILEGAWGYKKEKHLRETVSNFIETNFEGYKLLIPKDYDILLKEQYGDYMKLPPIEKQVFRHRCQMLDFGKFAEEAQKGGLRIGENSR